MKRRSPSIDSVTTINDDGSRYFVHPAEVHGRFTTWRRLVAPCLIAIYILLPIVPINGAPAVFIDLANRRFHLFGLTFIPQDLWLLFFLISGVGFSLFVITALFGRIWCGWACPQTVFLEHVFRQIEAWIDGDAVERRRQDMQPMTPRILLKRVFKNVIFFIVSAAIAHIFVSYFVSLPGLYGMMRQNPTANFGTFLFVFGLTVILFFNFAWFREQFCIVVCPYGRLQSALIDDESIVIGYDPGRGEPRGKAGSTTGDCVDCRRCVQVCPTGIDIRHGLQLECVSCANCIDACDEIMDRLGRARGLIRYDSLNALAGKPSGFFRPRLILYVFLALAGASVFLLSARQIEPVAASVVRMHGAPYFLEQDRIRNNFMLRIANKKSTPESFQIAVTAPGKHIAIAGGDQELVLQPGEEIQHPLILSVPDAEFGGKFDIEITVTDSTGKSTKKSAAFLGPFRE